MALLEYFRNRYVTALKLPFPAVVTTEWKLAPTPISNSNKMNGGPDGAGIHGGERCIVSENKSIESLPEIWAL